MECGYDLAGLATPRCPECGRVFAPDDPATFAVAPQGDGRAYVRSALFALLMLAAGIAASFVETYYRHDDPWLRCLFPLIPAGLVLAGFVAVLSGDALKVTPRNGLRAKYLVRARWLCLGSLLAYIVVDVVPRVACFRVFA